MVKTLKLEERTEIPSSEFEGYKLDSSKYAEISSLPLDDFKPIVIETPTHGIEQISSAFERNNLFHNPFDSTCFYFFGHERSLIKVEIGEEHIVERVLEGLGHGKTSKDSNCSITFLTGSLFIISRGLGLELFNEDSLTVLCTFHGFGFDSLSLSFRPDNDGGRFFFIGGNKTVTLFKNYLCVVNIDSDQTFEVLQEYYSTTRPKYCHIDKHGICLGSATGIFPLQSLDCPKDCKSNFFLSFTQTENEIFLEIECFVDEKLASLKELSIKAKSFELVISDPNGSTLMRGNLFEQVKEDYKVTLEKTNQLHITLFKVKASEWPQLWSKESTNSMGSFDQDLFDEINIRTYSLENPMQCMWKSLGNEKFLGSLSDNQIVLAQGEDAVAYKLDYENSRLVNTKSYAAISYIKASKEDLKYLLFSKDAAIIVENRKYIFVYQQGNRNILPQYLFNLQEENSEGDQEKDECDQFLANKEANVIGHGFIHGSILIILTMDRVFLLHLHL